MSFKAPVLALSFLFLSAPAWAAGKADASGVRTSVRSLDAEGLTQRLLLVEPPSPRAVLVMLPGGTGDVGISDDGSLKHRKNFLVRTRARFAAHGFAVVIVDGAGTRNLRGRRASPAYGRLVAEIARFAGEAEGRPVFLVGTSQGAIAAVNGAAQAGSAIAGVILTEAVSRRGGSKETVFDARPGAVTAPALVIANTDDACPVAPPSDAARIAASLKGAADVRVVHVSGGVARGRVCGSRSPHGYWKMEDKVVQIIASWVDARLAR